MGLDQFLVRMIETFYRQRAAAELSDDEVENLCRYCQRVVAHPVIGTATALTSELRVMAPDLGWARTMSRRTIGPLLEVAFVSKATECFGLMQIWPSICGSRYFVRLRTR